MFQLRNLTVSQASQNVKYGEASRARTDDDQIMSLGL